MSEFSIVTKPWHPVTIFDGCPELQTHRDCYFVPIKSGSFWAENYWGVYDKDGMLIDAAAHRSYPNMALAGQSEKCPLDLSNAPYAPKDCYFYVGTILNHYGHFMLSSMSRLWALPQIDLRKIPVIGHAGGSPALWFSWPFVRPLFGAAGLNLEDFADFDEPVRIRELIVAYPSFVELNQAHTEGAHAAHAWGDRMVKPLDLSAKSNLVYLSRAKYKRRPYGIGNEMAIVSELAKRGVKIINPELLSIPEQIAIFRTTKIIVGEIGSAFHTSLFSRPLDEQRLICIVQASDVYGTNHALVDGINGNNSEYINFPGDWKDEEGLKTLHIHNPERVAKAILEFALSDSERSYVSPRERLAAAAPLPRYAGNLALFRHAAQSSLSIWSKSNDAEGAVNGIRTGTYGFHTDIEACPWWQVDIGTSRRLSEVRVFNRLDDGIERARSLRVLVSNDNASWTEIHAQNDEPFGADSQPLRVFCADVWARYVRLQLTEETYLHLDEVEVY